MLRIFPWIGLVMAVAGCASRGGNELVRYDVVIRNGRVIDGTGGPAYRADVAIKGDRIAAIGTIPSGGAAMEIDAGGLVVAPGFIDVHTHADGDVLRYPLAENFVRDGVTTIVSGNCGSSVTDVGDYFQRIGEKGAAVNVATLVGHNSVLRAVKGDRAGDLTADQMVKAKEMVRQAMLDGAAGMSTGLIYLPGKFSKTEEIIELQKVAGSLGGVYATHMRSEASEILVAIDEVLRVGREAGCRVHISHFKLPADAARKLGGSAVTLHRVLEARDSGMEVWLDQYPYTASSTGITTLIPDRFLREGAEALRQKIADAVYFAQVLDAMVKEQVQDLGRAHLAWVVIAQSSGAPGYNGRNLREVAQTMKQRERNPGGELISSAKTSGEVDMRDQCAAALRLFMAGDTSCVFHTMNEPEVENIMRSPIVAVASDSGIRQFGAGVPHPRGYGTNARVLGRYVRERKLISLEEGVRKMTSLPAHSFRVTGRGVLREGSFADITIFHPDRVVDNATFEKPHQYPTGISAVVVNGVVVFEKGQMTRKLPGRPIYGPGRRS